MQRKTSERVYAPEVISLYSKASAIQTLFFIEQLYNYEVDVIVVDFSKTKHITAAAALAVLAHINAIQLFKNNVGCFQFDCKNSPIYRSFFIEEGYLKELKQLAVLYKSDEAFVEGSIRKMGSEKGFAQQREMNLQDIREFEESLKTTIIKQNPLADLQAFERFFRSLKTAISEVLLNIKHHAYDNGETIDTNTKEFDVYKEKPWWQMFWYSPQSRQITFILCDLGVGVVNSYLKHATKAHQRTFLNDKDVFTEALSEGKSRFVGGGRGNGLANVVKIAHDNIGASLMIMSGEVAYFAKNGQTYFLDLEGNNLTGTLVEWVFEVPVWS